MDSFLSLLHGFETALSGWNLLYCLLGVTIGMLVGILPGLGPVAGTALLIPVTFGMDPVSAIIMLAGIYYGSMYGGTITSVLINVPGETASVITCIDGHQMAKQGRAGAALGIAAIGSFIGGVTAIVCLALIGPVLANLALKFGPPEFFAIMMFGLVMLIALVGKSIIRGLVAAAIGLLLSLVGMDPITGLVRFNFGQTALLDGFDFTILAIGLFAFSEILISLEQSIESMKPAKIGGLMPRRDEWKPSFKAIGRGTGIGMMLGLIPGASAIIASLMSYTTEKRLAKDPSRFGKGAIEGVAGPETANNAHSGASLIPLFTLGLPTSPTVAVILSAFILHGLTPGPTLFTKNPDFTWGVIASMFIGNVILLIMNLPMIRLWAKIAAIPYKLLYPLILIVTLTGTYAVNRSLWDVAMTVFFGIVGYFFRKLDIPIAAIIFTFVLGSQIESSFLQSLATSQNGMLIFFTRPISSTILGIAILVLLLSIFSGIKNKRMKIASDVEM
ncbi:MAG TPA: tripartite tricarboxylate transporter permease [Paenibacillaceae bacterium]